MALKAILTKIEDAPEALREHYVEKDGKFFLGVESVDGYALEDVSGLKSALGSERTAKERAEALAAAFKDIDPAKAREALAKVEELGSIDPAKEADKIVGARLEAAKAQLVEKHNGEVKTRDDRIGFLAKTVEGLLVDAAATAALAEAKGSVELLLPHVKAHTRVKEVDGKFQVEVIDAAGNGRIADAKGTPMGIKDLVAEMRGSDTFARAFDGDGHSGSGKEHDTGGGGGGAGKGDFGGDRDARQAAIKAKFNLKD